MDGPQNMLQGSAGFGAIPGKDQPENEPWPTEEMDWAPYMAAMYAAIVVFHSDQANLDQLRWYRETFQARDYMNISYFELWMQAVCHSVANNNMGGITAQDLIDKKILTTYQSDHASIIQNRGDHQAVLGFGRPDKSGRYDAAGYKEDAENAPKLKAGQAVRGRLQRSAGHTRQYEYVRGRKGVIDRVYPVAVVPKGKNTGSGKYEAEYPDLNSKGKQHYLIPLYSVRYRCEDLWGKDFGESHTVVYADQWEPYIEPDGSGA
jgi:hypothetical protein